MSNFINSYLIIFSFFNFNFSFFFAKTIYLNFSLNIRSSSLLSSAIFFTYALNIFIRFCCLYGTKIVVSISFYTFNVSIALDDYSNIAIRLLLFSAFAAFASSSSLIYSGVFSYFSSTLDD